jgi:hypothetical protein
MVCDVHMSVLFLSVAMSDRCSGPSCVGGGVGVQDIAGGELGEVEERVEPAECGLVDRVALPRPEVSLTHDDRELDSAGVAASSGSQFQALRVLGENGVSLGFGGVGSGDLIAVGMLGSFLVIKDDSDRQRLDVGADELGGGGGDLVLCHEINITRLSRGLHNESAIRRKMIGSADLEVSGDSSIRALPECQEGYTRRNARGQEDMMVVREVATEALLYRDEKVIDKLLSIKDPKQRAKQASKLVEHYMRLAGNAGDARSDALVELKDAGSSYGDLADLTGLSRARILQIVQKNVLASAE